MPLRRLIPALTAALALALLPVLPAHAATGVGWARLAHLSPDTRAVDVRIAPLDEGGKVVRLSDVAYGAVSDYLTLPAGEYAVAMRPAGSAESATPIIQKSFRVTAGDASTVAVFGRNADLQVEVVKDALKVPPVGDARIRVVQAATGGEPVTVTATDDDEKTIVSKAALGTVSDYTDVKAGRWKLTALRGSTTSDSTVDLKSGQIASLFVLQDADGGVVIKSVLDSASAGDLPKGYLATGGGFLAHEQRTQTDELLVGGGIAALIAGAGALLVARRRVRARA